MTMRFIFMLFFLFTVGLLHAQDTPKKITGLKFTALDGKKVDLKDYKGKLVLIDCWATWCGPCLKEMAHLKELYDKYHAQGFEIIGISLDNEVARDRAKTILKNKNITWPQRFEGKGVSDDSFAKEFAIKQLPTVFLLDKQGNIVDTDARGEKLEPLIVKYLAQP